MASKTQYGSIIFKQKIDFVKNKLALPTETYADIWQVQHAKAFVVAGAIQDEILADFQSAVLKAVEGGSTLEDFRKDFDATVKKHGWSYNGGRNWRSRIIYETNTRMAYAAGRYQQMQAVKRTRPYLQYQHSIAVENARPQHLGWHGMVLSVDDPWWNTHYPPNGWGCQCYAKTLSQRELDAQGLTLANSPKVEWTDKTIGVTTNPRVIQVTDGVDAGFAYNPGKAAWGQQLSETAMADFKASGAKVWQSIIKHDYQQLGRPRKLPLAQPKQSLTDKGLTVAEMALLIESQLGATERIIDVKGLPVLVNAQSLAEHLDPNRSIYLPLLLDTLEDPFEVWMNFDEHQATGKVALRTRIVKAFDIGRGKVLLISAQANKGILESWTMIPTSDLKYINRQRNGKLIYGKIVEEE
ncbi:MAG: hypothetical protein GXO35_07630 [Gammaproteobacteria bacterium]|nr:hypothetical protein [Gammaproteobacteria bacterium]